jgi:hypothetical protein
MSQASRIAYVGQALEEANRCGRARICTRTLAWFYAMATVGIPDTLTRTRAIARAQTHTHT